MFTYDLDGNLTGDGLYLSAGWNQVAEYAVPTSTPLSLTLTCSGLSPLRFHQAVAMDCA